LPGEKPKQTRLLATAERMEALKRKELGKVTFLVLLRGKNTPGFSYRLNGKRETDGEKGEAGRRPF
jgi:hypothetical protein